VDRNQLYLPGHLRSGRGIGESDVPGSGWYIVAGIVSVFAGLVVLAWPFEPIVVLTLAAGIWLVIIGITPNRPSVSKPARPPVPHAKRSTKYQTGWPPP
jgi:hypothetical protein